MTLDSETCRRLAAECTELAARISAPGVRFSCGCLTCRGVAEASLAFSRNSLSAIAEQLAAAAQLMGHNAKLNQLLSANAETYQTMRRAHEAELELVSNARREIDHWREARRIAIEAGEMLLAERDTARVERDTARAEVDHWREARRIAIKAGEMLLAERDTARAEVERLKAELVKRGGS